MYYFPASSKLIYWLLAKDNQTSIYKIQHLENCSFKIKIRSYSKQVHYSKRK